MVINKVYAIQRENHPARISRGEANYLPNLPDRHDKSSNENGRKIVIEEMKKKLNKNNVTVVSPPRR